MARDADGDGLLPASLKPREELVAALVHGS